MPSSANVFLNLNDTFADTPVRMAIYRREFVLNIGFLLLANLLIKPFYVLFIERDFQNQAGNEAWGLYFTLFSLSMIPQILLDLGMTVYVNQKISSDRSAALEIWKNTAWLRPFFALAFLVLYFLLAGNSMRSQPFLILGIAINQILLAGILYLRAFVSGLGHYRLDSLFSVADKLIFILLALFIFPAFEGQPVFIFLSIQFYSLVIPLVTGLFWFWFKTKPGLRMGTLPAAIGILRQCFPYAMIFILMVLFSRMEPVWLNGLRNDGAQQSGIYAAAYRLLDAANMLGFLFAGILMPMFAHATGQKLWEQRQSLFDLAWKLMIVLASLIAMPLAFQHRYIMQALYTDPAEDILHLTILNLVPLTINYLLSTLLTAVKEAGAMNRLFLISICINAAGHLLVTRSYGAAGAAGVALVTQTITAFLLAGLIHLRKIIRFQWKHFGLMVMVLGMAVLTGTGVLYSGLPAPAAIPVHVLALLILVFSSNLLPLAQVFRLVFKPGVD